MSRRGIAMIEMMAYLVALAVILPVTGTMTVQLLRLERQVSDTGMAEGLLESSCFQLRRDAARGWRWTEGTLVAGDHRWTVADGWLRRDGSNRYAPCAWRVTGADGALLVAIRAAGGEERIIRLRGDAP